MPDVEQSIIIDAHPAQVWPYLFGSPEKVLDWQHKTGPYSSIAHADLNITDDPDGNKMGAVTCKTTDGRQVIMKLVDYNEPQWITLSCQYMVSPLFVDQFLTFELEPAEGKTEGIKTKLTMAVEWYLDGANFPMRLLSALGAKKKFTEMLFFSLKNIKEIVEKNTITSNEEAVLTDVDE